MVGHSLPTAPGLWLPALGRLIRAGWGAPGSAVCFGAGQLLAKCSNCYLSKKGSDVVIIGQLLYVELLLPRCEPGPGQPEGQTPNPWIQRAT